MIFQVCESEAWAPFTYHLSPFAVFYFYITWFDPMVDITIGGGVLCTLLLTSAGLNESEDSRCPLRVFPDGADCRKNFGCIQWQRPLYSLL